MNREELLKLREEIKADLAAVDQLLSRPARQERLVALAEAHRPPTSTSEMAEMVIKKLKADFTVPDVCFELRKLGKKITPYTSPIVSQVINRLRQRKPPEVEVVRAGRGRRSGTYRYKKPTS